MIVLYIIWIAEDMNGNIPGIGREGSFLATVATSGIGVVCGLVLASRDRGWWRAVGVYAVVVHTMIWPATLVFLERIWTFIIGAK